MSLTSLSDSNKVLGKSKYRGMEKEFWLDSESQYSLDKCKHKWKKYYKYKYERKEKGDRRWTVKARTDISCQEPPAHPICNAKPLRKKSQPMQCIDLSGKRKEMKSSRKRSLNLRISRRPSCNRLSWMKIDFYWAFYVQEWIVEGLVAKKDLL